MARIYCPQFLHMVIYPMKNAGHKRGHVHRKLTPEAKAHDIVMPAKLPLLRNLDIVLTSDVVLATSKEAHMVQRSGTWSTVRYALIEEKQVLVFQLNSILGEHGTDCALDFIFDWVDDSYLAGRFDQVDDFLTQLDYSCYEGSVVYTLAVVTMWATTKLSNYSDHRARITARLNELGVPLPYQWEGGV